MPSYPQYVEAAAAAQRVAGVKNVHNHLEVVLPQGDYRDDATLTTTANNALELNITVPDGVEATAKNGNLTLTGTVNYGTERTAAELTVAGLTGVRNIKNDIQISNDADLVDVTVLVQDALDRYALIPDDSDVVVDTNERYRRGETSQRPGYTDNPFRPPEHHLELCCSRRACCSPPPSASRRAGNIPPAAGPLGDCARS